MNAMTDEQKEQLAGLAFDCARAALAQTAASGEPDQVEQAQALAAAFSRGHDAGWQSATAHHVAQQPAASGEPVAWIGLTDREKDKCWRRLGDGDGFPEYAEAIELMLRKKNANAQPAPAPADIAAKLRDPVAVHAAMLRGEIATPAIRDMLHVYGADALARWDNAQPAPARVPLTDEQIDEEWFDIYQRPINAVAKARLLARAIEAAHGITPAKEAP